MNHETLLREATPRRHATRFAVLVASTYLVTAVTWILYSDYVAGILASTPQQLATLQRWKGLGFVGTSAMLIFFLTRYLFRRVRQQAQAVMQAREALSELERNATAAIILQSLVHDFRNHTQVAWGNLQLLAPDVDQLPRTQQELLERIRQSVSRLMETLERNHACGARTLSQDPSVMDLTAYLEVCVDLLRRHPKVALCEVAILAPEPVMLTGVKALLHDAMTNLVINAAEALGGRGRIEVRVAALPDGAVVEVHDSGPGIGDADVSRVFEPFFTTKAAGTGLGLLSVKACAEVHGGTASVGGSDLGGASFRMTLHNLRRPSLVADAEGEFPAVRP
ncbi:MAG TPA: HAMP domain-containing sensor histidine kinase [bacterium]